MSKFFCAEMFSNKVFLNDWRESTGGSCDVVEPATGNVLAKIALGSSDDIRLAVTEAKKQQSHWANLPFDQRGNILRRAAELILQHKDTFIEWNIRECGSMAPKAEAELHASLEQLNMAAAMTMQPDGVTLPSAIPGRRNTCRRVPLGVVGVITPWNFPLLLAMRSVAPALAAGNSVVLKPDHQSAITGGLLIARLFEEAGLPKGVLQVIPGGAEAGEALVEHPMTAMISFTGSTNVGKKIGRTCGELLKKSALELGGNNAFIVLDDADIEAASSHGAWGAYLHQGQICMQAGRHFVHESVAEEYISRLAERAERLRVADPYLGASDIGPLINASQLAKINKIITESVEAGAKLITGGHSHDQFYRPTVLSNIRVDMPACQQELFGPVAPVITFSSEDELVEMIAASPYGLAAAIHSRSIGRAMKLADRVPAGMIHINDQTVNNEFHVPFGGFGDSGNSGRFGGPANFEEFTQSQWVSVMDIPVTYPF